jgi:hypothetical protein
VRYDPRDPDDVTAIDELELANKFDRQRPQLRAVACRILGPVSDACDAVQEARCGCGGPTPSRSTAPNGG